MQFTGVYDNNGKEIYEGDIIKTEIGISKAVEDMTGCLLDWGYRVGECVESIGEVVGNIYENPDLLPAPTDSLSAG